MPLAANESDKRLIHQGDTTQKRNEWEELTPLQAFFLNRLECLLNLRAGLQADNSSQEWLRRGTDRAIYATLRDCQEQAVGQQAKAILNGAHRAN